MGSVIGFMFSPSGRFRRLDYWLHAFANVALWFVFAFILFTRVQGLADAMRQMQVEHSHTLPPEFAKVGFIFFVFLLVMLFSSCTSVIKRFHDFGSSGWNLLWLFVPFANIWFAIKLMFFRGQDGDNQYGMSPYR